ncbi:MAG: phospho-sugar mutase [Anaerobacillus sp.]|uniref:phospho-sugar mutase n=1 Tax=Anaerobacillus sp. TaxID=1872506 RepID=UPI00391C83C3
MNWKTAYERWTTFQKLDHELKEQLARIQEDEHLLEDCFYKTLEFGTGGLRGELGPGINRLNIYTIRKVTEGLAQYINAQGEKAKKQGVVIAYDSRHKSSEFSLEAAKILTLHGIQVYLFDELQPTPLLSFAVRELKAAAGIVITASHNPPEYNGYKVYGSDGGQVTLEVANEIITNINKVYDELHLPVADKDEVLTNGLLKMVGQELEDEYMKVMKSIVVNEGLLQESAKEVKVVFTPLHGTANKLVQRGLTELGFKQVYIVKEQEQPDPNFSTISSPNPEEHRAFEWAIKYGEKVGADILMGTDPDADRVGVVVRGQDGKYIVLSGNQTGALMLDYLLRYKKDIPKNGVILKTIVTSEIGRVIAEKNGLETIDTLTGFKYIGERIKEFETTKERKFLFGYEESYGYLVGDFVRDKDAVQACLFIAEVATYYKKMGKSLYEGLLEIYKKYGYFQEDLQTITLKGKNGLEQMATVMEFFRGIEDLSVGGAKVTIREDYRHSIRKYINKATSDKIYLPSSDVLKFILSDGSWFCVRPSGTEPKIKFYFGVKDNSLESSITKLATLKDMVLAKVGPLVKI